MPGRTTALSGRGRSPRNLVVLALVVAVGAACGRPSGGATITPPGSAISTVSPSWSPTESASPSPSQQPSATSSPASSARQNVFTIFKLTIYGSVPSGDGFQLYYDTRGQTLLGICDPWLNPCIGGGKTYTQSLGYGPPGGMKAYSYELVQWHGNNPNPTVTVFASGTIDTSHDNTVSASYSF